MALLATTAVAGLCFLDQHLQPAGGLHLAAQPSGMTGFIAWLGIAISHYRFRKAYELQGLNNALPTAPPRSSARSFAFVLCLVITLARTTRRSCKSASTALAWWPTYVGLAAVLPHLVRLLLAKGTRIVPLSGDACAPELH